MSQHLLDLLLSQVVWQFITVSSPAVSVPHTAL